MMQSSLFKPASSVPRKKARWWLCCNVLKKLDERMKETRLKRGIIISALQSESLTHHNPGFRPGSGQRPGTELQEKKK